MGEPEVLVQARTLIANTELCPPRRNIVAGVLKTKMTILLKPTLLPLFPSPRKPQLEHMPTSERRKYQVLVPGWTARALATDGKAKAAGPFL